jgi:hypothetical protein
VAPQPREVFQLVRSLGWTLLRGNHEDYVLAQCCDLLDDNPLGNPIWQPARWTAQQIGKQGDNIATLPDFDNCLRPARHASTHSAWSPRREQ